MAQKAVGPIFGSLVPRKKENGREGGGGPDKGSLPDQKRLHWYLDPESLSLQVPVVIIILLIEQPESLLLSPVADALTVLGGNDHGMWAARVELREYSIPRPWSTRKGPIRITQY